MARAISRYVPSISGRATSFAATAPAPATPVARPAIDATPEADELSGSLTRFAHWRPDVVATITILIFTGLVSWHRLWLQNGLAHLDIPTFYLPWYAYMGEHLRALDIPGWNPHLFSGTAFAGDPQSGWMYVPAMVFFTIFESVRAYELYLIFHLALAGLATYAYARTIGLGPVAGVGAAFAYELGPFVNHISCCLIHVQLAVWIPVALLGIELMMRSMTWSGRAAAWCLTAFAISQMLAGWVGQGFYNGLLVVGSYLLYRLVFTAVVGVISWRQRLVRLVIDGAAILALGIGFGAAGILPRLDIVEHTNLAGGEYSGHEVDAYSAGWGFASFVNHMISDDNGFRSLTFYLGVPVVALALMGVYLARTRYRAPFFMGLTAFASIMSFHPTWFHSIVFTVLPRYESLHEHVPNRVLAIQWLGPAMLAGIAIEMLSRETSPVRVKRAAIVGCSVVGFGIFVIVVNDLGITLTSIVFALATCGVVAVLLYPTVWATRHPDKPLSRTPLIFGGVLVLLIFLDPAGRGMVDTMITGEDAELLAIPTGPVDRDAISINASKTDGGGAGELFQELEASGEHFRYIGYDYSLYESGNGFPSTYREYYWLPEAQAILVNARAMPLEIEDAQGYNPMQLSNYINAVLFANHEEQNYHDSQFMAEGIDSPILDMLNVRYIVIPNEIPASRPRPDIMEATASFPEVFRNDTIRVLERPGALPRAWAVHDTRVATPNFSLLMIDAGIVDPGEIAFVEPGMDVPPVAEPDDPAAETVTIINDGADEMELEVDLAAPGLVLVSQTYDSGWNAYVDGEQVELLQANGVIQAVPVPAGTHAVKLVYEPASLRVGIAISAAAGALMLAIVAAYVWLRLGLPSPRRSRTAAVPG